MGGGTPQGRDAFRGDPNSVANYDSFMTRHIAINWQVDFANSKLVGSTLLRVERMRTAPETLLLDATRLKILHITDAPSGEALSFEYSSKGGKFGGVLKIELPTGPVGSLYQVLYALVAFA